MSVPSPSSLKHKSKGQHHSSLELRAESNNQLLWLVQPFSISGIPQALLSLWSGMSLSNLFVLGPTLSIPSTQSQLRCDPNPSTTAARRNTTLLPHLCFCFPGTAQLISESVTQSAGGTGSCTSGTLSQNPGSIRGSCPCTDGVSRHRRFYSLWWDFSRSHSPASVLTSDVGAPFCCSRQD